MPSGKTLTGIQNERGVSLSSFWKLLGLSFRAYRKKFFLLACIVAIPLLFLILLILGMLGAGRLGENPLLPGFGFLFSPGVLFSAMFLGMLTIFFHVWAHVALLYAVMAEESHLGAWEAYRESFHKIGSVIWIGVLSTLAVVGGTLLFFIPGIIFSIALTFALYVFFGGRDTGLTALRKSGEYVKGSWWGVFGRIVFAVFLVGLATGLLFLFNSLLVINALIPLLLLFFTFLFIPFGIIYLFEIFRELKEGKPWVAQSFSSARMLLFTTILGLLFLLIAPTVLAARGALQAFPSLYSSGVLAIQNIFGNQPRSSESSLSSEQLQILHASRDEKRIADISALREVFDAIVFWSRDFCGEAAGKIYRSTSPSGGGSGWLPLDLSLSGMDRLTVTHPPRDPVNTSQYRYEFACGPDGAYELNARFEYTGSFARASHDNGSNDSRYEVGTNLRLIP